MDSLVEMIHESNAHVTYKVDEMADTGVELYGAFFTDNPDSMQIDLEALTVTTWDGRIHDITGVDFLSFGNRNNDSGGVAHMYLSDAALEAAGETDGSDDDSGNGGGSGGDGNPDDNGNNDDTSGDTNLDDSSINHSLSHDVLFVGHSLVNTEMPEMVQTQIDHLNGTGQTDYQMIIGSSLQWNWNNSDSGQGVNARDVLAEGQTEILVITEAVPLINHTTWSNTYEYAANYYNLAVDSNPDAQVYLYETWHSIDSGTGVDVPYDDNDDISWRTRLDQDLSEWEAIVDSVNAQRGEGDPEMLLVPAGQALAEVYDQVLAGNFPGITTEQEFFDAFFVDDIHMSDLGNFFISMVQTTTIYGVDSAELSNSYFDEYGNNVVTVPDDLMTVLENIVLDVVTTYPRSGVVDVTDDGNPDNNDIPDDTGDDTSSHESNAHVTYKVDEMADTGVELYGAFFTDNPDSMQIDLEALTVTTWDGRIHDITGVDFLSFGNRNNDSGGVAHMYLSDAALEAAGETDGSDDDSGNGGGSGGDGNPDDNGNNDVAEGVLNPSGAINLSPLEDWGTALPIIDLMKQSREWIVTEDGGWWGGVDMADVHDAGLVDENGWITNMPDGAWRISNILLHQQASSNPEVTAGEYTLRYEGEGTIRLNGHGLNILSQSEGEIIFELTGDVHSIMMHIDGTDPNDTGDYIRDVSVVKSEFMELHELGEIFNPEWINLIQDFRVVRFMDWMKTNGNTVSEWSQVSTVDSYSWSQEAGMPVEVMVELANQAGVDPWFTIPFHASDDYVRQFAEYVAENLDPELKAHIEFSNEVWNYSYGFPQTAEADELGRELFGTQFGDYPHRQYYGYRSAQIMDIFEEVFAEAADDRLIKILATQTRNDDWPLLTATQGIEVYANEVGKEVSDFFDQVAGTWYFGGELGRGDFAEQVLGWVDTYGENRAIDMIFEQLSGDAVHIDISGMPSWVSNPSVATVLSYIETQAEFAKQYGWELTSYEGGSHMVGVGEYQDLMTELFVKVHEDPRLTDLYEQIYEGWIGIENTAVLTQFYEVNTHGRWGSFAALQDLYDESGRWDFLLEANQNPADWEERVETAFDQGILEFGTDQNDVYEGTSEEDFLIGHAGDDVLSGFGGEDGLHGGAGNDTINGGFGSDILFGGSDADLFIFDALDGTSDVIGDFDAGQGDKIDLSELLSQYNVLDDAIADFVSVTQDGTDMLIGVSDTGDGINYAEIVRLEGVSGLLDVDTLVADGIIIVA